MMVVKPTYARVRCTTSLRALVWKELCRKMRLSPYILRNQVHINGASKMIKAQLNTTEKGIKGISFNQPCTLASVGLQSSATLISNPNAAHSQKESINNPLPFHLKPQIQRTSNHRSSPPQSQIPFDPNSSPPSNVKRTRPPEPMSHRRYGPVGKGTSDRGKERMILVGQCVPYPVQPSPKSPCTAQELLPCSALPKTALPFSSQPNQGHPQCQKKKKRKKLADLGTPGSHSAPAAQELLSVTCQPALVDHQPPSVEHQPLSIDHNPATKNLSPSLVRRKKEKKRKK